jgi:arginase
MAEFECIGVPYFIGARIERRTEVFSVRDSGIAREIGAGWREIEPDATAPDPISGVNRALAEAVAQCGDAIPIVFASDCVSALGAVKGLGGDLGVVWYDAHGDFNTPETTRSGFLGGMPLAMLVGRGDMRYMRALDLAPLDERDIILSDARDLDPAEAIALRDSDVMRVPDLGDLLTTDLPDKPLYVHLDVDVVRLDDMPGVAYPSDGGPSLDMVAQTLERVARDGRVVGLLVSLWNDDLVQDRRALDHTLHLVRTFVGGIGAGESA